MAKKPTDDTKINPITWEIPLLTGESISIPRKPGKPLFIVGANGSGKSALIQKFLSDLDQEDGIYFERHPAHRQSWFEAVANSGVLPQLESYKIDIMQTEASPAFRWTVQEKRDNTKHLYILGTLLKEAIAHTERIARLIQEKKYGEIELENTEDPLIGFNELLKKGNLDIVFELAQSRDRFIVRHDGNKMEIDIRKMSDGERFVVLFAASVTALPPDSVLLIDEPDLHFHQSIIAPFFSALVASRKDCFFVFSTHDTTFPSAYPDSDVVIVQSCKWVQDLPTRFDALHLDANAPIPEYVKRDILGARKKVLYVEGKEWSLDFPLYKKLFPKFTVIPKEGYSLVDKSVRGMRESEELHRVEAWGIVDKDWKSNRDIENTIKKDIGVLKVWSVESIYYSHEAISAVARHQVSVSRILSEVYKILKKENVAEIIISHLARRKMEQLGISLVKNVIEKPHSQLRGTPPVFQMEDYPGIYIKGLEKFMALVEEGESSKIAKRNIWSALNEFPLLKSDAFNTIAQALNLDKESYENTLLSLVEKDEVLANSLRKYINMPPGFYDD